MATMGEQIAAEISEITSNRDTIRNKMIEIGEADSTANLSTLATAIAALTDNGAVSANVKEGETYTIPKGFHNGSGTVKGVAGGGNYELQVKTVTPTKSQQNVTSDEGYYGLSAVTVGAIPAAYQDVTSTTVTAADVLANKVYVATDGTPTTGTMPNNGKITKTLSTSSKSYTIAKGYHDGTGTVSIATEEKTATPSKSSQSITPTSGKVLSKVTVAEIPAAYQDVTGVTATAAHVLDGDAFVDSTGAEVEGTMPNNGAQNLTIDALTVTNVSIPAGYTSGGTVSLTNDLLEALQAI